jgi:hypothetical protein
MNINHVSNFCEGFYFLKIDKCFLPLNNVVVFGNHKDLKG